MFEPARNVGFGFDHAAELFGGDHYQLYRVRSARRQHRPSAAQKPAFAHDLARAPVGHDAAFLGQHLDRAAFDDQKPVQNLALGQHHVAGRGLRGAQLGGDPVLGFV